MSEVAKIAAGLTKAQRDALMDPEWYGSGETQFALVDCIQTKLTGPLARPFTLRRDRLTPLGLAVRQYLLDQEHSL